MYNVRGLNLEGSLDVNSFCGGLRIRATCAAAGGHDQT